jgi:hypothetical protein
MNHLNHATPVEKDSKIMNELDILKEKIHQEIDNTTHKNNAWHIQTARLSGYLAGLHVCLKFISEAQSC